MPKVSVIMPAYNNERYLSQAIESVLHQTCIDYELLIIDDGSTDRTGDIAKGYRAKHPGRVRYLLQENKGPGAARNAGLREAKGEYIAFLDADDMWEEKKLEKQMAVFEASPETGLVYSDFYYIDKDNTMAVRGSFRRYQLPRGDVALEFFSHYFIFTSTVLMRETYIGKVGFFREDINVGEDYDYFLRVAALCRVEGVEEKLLAKRSREDSLSSIDWILNAKNDILILNGFIERNPGFYLKNKRVISYIMGCRYFSLGYWFLKTGERKRSFYYLLSSFRYQCTFRAVKCLLQLPLPLLLLRFAKRMLGNREIDLPQGG